MRIRFLDTARIELDEAVAYYQQEVPGFGDEFLAEVLQTLDRIGRLPLAWAPCSKRTRRCLTRRFPYGIVYQIRNDGILVIAIANLHRRPEYWKDRI